MGKGKVLVVGSNATRIEVQGGGWGATGQYLNETVVPAMAVIDAGYEVVLATPDGTKPHIDEASDSARAFRAATRRPMRVPRSSTPSHPAMNEVAHAALGDRGGAGQLCRRVRARRPSARWST